MKRFSTVALLISVFAAQLQAQTDTKAKAILDQVAKKYSTTNISKSGFTYTIEDPDTKAKQVQSGTLYVKARTNKFKLVLKDQEMISDGKTQWTYLKEEKEVQVNNSPADNSQFNPAQLFNMYQKGYKYVYPGDSKVNGKICNVIELAPLDTKGSVFKIRLSIDKATKSLVNALIFDRNGNRYTYAITSFVPGIKVSESIFTFDKSKYPGVEVVDLR
ncbi:outer membrane lipoprotein carrier protein LolA [Pedobacter sp. HMF7647]|uniref:Outer membrane lipoprotein carrier protein LolA n=1 Tax=Hufsiella arboris TaxID=2695275 RepID=A0A7K1YDT4_9SPHI|nr:outer membrane lipoprotein carrier protein LolA [Hufsiella arboris]MXV52560.1 outer membrane lipoprotein carrier protein LolA [Hufsiella arboris]